MVLVDGRANPDTPEAALEREQAARRCLREGSARVFADTLIDRAFAPEAPSALKRRWHTKMARTAAAGAAAAARALASRVDSRPTLQTIDAPTLLVCGSHDEITPPALMREMHEAILGSRFAVIEGAGHMTPVERPEAFAERLAAFIDSMAPL